MNEKHFPKLELCKKLTDLGFPYTQKKIFDKIDMPTSGYKYPSVSELLDEMPQIGDNLFSIQKWGANQYVCIYTIIVNGHFLCSRGPSILPNALAEMWIWLKENNYLTK